MPELYEIGSQRCVGAYEFAMQNTRELDLTYVGRLEYNNEWCMYVGNKNKTHTDVALIEITPPGWRFKRGYHFKFKKFKPNHLEILELSKHMTTKAKLIEGADAI